VRRESCGKEDDGFMACCCSSDLALSWALICRSCELRTPSCFRRCRAMMPPTTAPTKANDWKMVTTCRCVILGVLMGISC